MVLSTQADSEVVRRDGHGGEWTCNRRSHRSRTHATGSADATRRVGDSHVGWGAGQLGRWAAGRAASRQHGRAITCNRLKGTF